MHTQGPWDVKPDYGKENVYRLWNVDGNYHDDTSPETMDANARLIAAAPELLEALKKARNAYMMLYAEALATDRDIPLICKMASDERVNFDAIIAKAEGTP